MVLFLAGYAEGSSASYEAELRRHIAREGIHAVFAHEHIGVARADGALKRYTLWDAYAHADLVTYPSVWEGWGNQFIEAVFAKKPVVLFEYPVFEADIKPAGYDFISLGNRYSRQQDTGLVSVPEHCVREAAERAVAVLADPGTPDRLERNFRIGQRHHDLTRLEEALAAEFATFADA